jgi:segregation and condensation protein A
MNSQKTILSSQSDTNSLPLISKDETPLAFVEGKPFKGYPKDLYIPPNALEIFLDMFEGPLDLLLYLIKRENLDILNIPIAKITEQYMPYVELMQFSHLELASEYLVMAAMLAEIKSRFLLPSPTSDDDEDDPRADLIRRLQEYERFKNAALQLDALPRIKRDIFSTQVALPKFKIKKNRPSVDLESLMLAFKEVIERSQMFTSHQIQREILSTREKMTYLLSRLSSHYFTDFETLFNLKEGRAGIIVTFLAILELSKSFLIELVQSESEFFSSIHVRSTLSAS